MLNICVCQLIKDEQRYIEEWIDYYLNLGISKFVLFEDWNSSSHADVLSKYGDKVILHKYNDVITEEDNECFNEVRQECVWHAFYRLYKDKFDACLFIDPDEYLACTREEFLGEAEYFKDDPNVNSIIYRWLTRTASGHIKDPHPGEKYSLVETYTDVLYGYNMVSKFAEYIYLDFNIQTKHLIYLKKLKSADEWIAPHGNDKMPGKEQESLFRLNHYITKSWEEYKYKLFVKGEQVKKWGRDVEQFFHINKDLLPYKDELLKECKNLEYKYNDIHTTVCICQIIKDEQRYIEEWIDYYLNLGIKKFILFEDWNSSSHADVLSKYGDKVVLYKMIDIFSEEELKNIKETRQELVWKYFYEHYKRDFDACLFFDADEYLDCNKEKLFQIINEYKKNTDIKFISFLWQTMTANKHINDPHPGEKYSIVDTYTEKYEGDFNDLNGNSKSLIFLDHINSYEEFNAPHGPWYWSYDANTVMISDVKLRHYLTKSWEEYKNRIYVRGEPCDRYYSRKIEHFFEINKDLLPYKEQLLKECEGLEYKYNDYN